MQMMVFIKSSLRKTLIMFLGVWNIETKQITTYGPVHLEYTLCQVLASYSTHRCVNRAKSLMLHYN